MLLAFGFLLFKKTINIINKINMVEDGNTTLLPSYNEMFKPHEVEAAMEEVMKNFFTDKQYDPTETSKWTKELASMLKQRVKAFNMPRYKRIVQVVIGENAGCGVRMGCRCLWDGQTDKMAKVTYMNDTIFAVAVTFGIYLY